MGNSRTFILLAITCFYLLTSTVFAVQYVEDFRDDTPFPPQAGFADTIFQHNITEFDPFPFDPFSPGPMYWEFGYILPNINNPSGNDFLILAPAMDEITFALEPGQFISHVSIEFIDYAESMTFVTVNGTLDSYTAQASSTGGIGGFGSVWETADTTGQNLGQITSVVLASLDGGFDNLIITVIPEPTSTLFLAIGAYLINRRYRNNTKKS